MNSLDRVLHNVATDRLVPSSTATMLHNVASEIRLAAGNEEACLALANMLDENGMRIGDHILASTPMIGSPLPVHPIPAPTASSQIPTAAGPTGATGATGAVVGPTGPTGATGPVAPKA